MTIPRNWFSGCPMIVHALELLGSLLRVGGQDGCTLAVRSL